MLRRVIGVARTPVVLVAHGASHGTGSSPLYLHLAEQLQRAGVATLLFDRRAAAPPGQTGITPAVLIDDLRSWVAQLRRHPAVCPERVSLWGHSQGCWLVAEVTARDASIAALMAVSPSGQSPVQQMAFATANLLREAGYDEHARADVTELRRAELEWERGELSTSAFADLVRASRAQPWFSLAYVGEPVEGEQDIGLAWSSLDVVSPLRSIRAPATMVLGTRDRWIDVERSREAWVTNLAGRQLEVVELTGAGHYPTLAEDPRDLTETGPWHPLYEQTLRRWGAQLTSRVPSHPPP